MDVRRIPVVGWLHGGLPKKKITGIKEPFQKEKNLCATEKGSSKNSCRYKGLSQKRVMGTVSHPPKE